MYCIKNISGRLIFLLAASIVMISSCTKSPELSNAGNAGQGGSLARFTIVGHYLYTVNRQSLHTYDLSLNPGEPKLVSETYIGWDIETIYPYQDHLFIGSMDAMYIFSLADPARPVMQGYASHLRSCDPVVAKDSMAYVTLRTNSTCMGEVNALMVYNVKYISSPVWVTQVDLEQPYGLGVRDNTLYICDDAAGLKVFDISDPLNPVMLRAIEGYTFRDCIPYGDMLICMVTEGMVVYDISDPFHPVFVTKVN